MLQRYAHLYQNVKFIVNYFYILLKIIYQSCHDPDIYMNIYCLYATCLYLH